MNYKVGDRDFYSFEEVVNYAWKEFEIEIFDIAVTEEEKQEACRELEEYIKLILE